MSNDDHISEDDSYIADSFAQPRQGITGTPAFFTVGDLKPAAFLAALAQSLASGWSEGESEGDSASEFHSYARSRIAQFWFGPDNPIHYEVALHERTGRLELGLHFEADPALNRALYAFFDKCLLEIQAELGPHFWLEDWDRGWARLYETYPLWPLSTERVETISLRLRKIISVLQPILQEALLR